MFEYLKGQYTEITPTYIVVDCNGVGYIAQISLSTYEKVKDSKEGTLFIHQSITENSHTLYGFYSIKERNLFRALTSVSGVGPSTARMVLSSQNTNDIFNAIIQGNLTLLKSIKGIGPKTAQRILIELQDKLGKMVQPEEGNTLTPLIATDSHSAEAIRALEALGFNKNTASKAVAKVKQQEPNAHVESIIKLALKFM